MHRDDIDTLTGALDQVDLARLLSDAGEAAIFVDDDWVVRYCNDVYLSNVGLPRSAVIDKTPFDYEPLFKRSIFYESIERCRRDRKPMTRIGYSTLLERWLMVRVFPVGGGMLMLANDASESVLKQYHLAQQVVKDTLTGLGNKVGLVAEMDQRLARREPFRLTALGLQRLRAINDAHGYSAGDMALLELASRLQTASLSNEKVYRLAGDEFAVLSSSDAPAPTERADSFVRALALPMHVCGQRFVVGAQAGIVDHPHDGADSETLLKRAALAMREAQKTDAGVVVYRQELELVSRLKAELESELRGAIEAKQLLLMLQPKASLLRGDVIGAEALIRWAHPKRGMLSPDRFLPVAQESGLMGMIDQFVLRQALAHVGELRSRGMRMPISINLSADSIADDCLVERVKDALFEARVEPALLEVEVPEGALMQDVNASVRVLEALHEMGVRISIDDFGTGYSSFAYLVRFPVHALKIDRSFVGSMESSGASLTIVKSIVRLAHSLSLTVVAEGAESEDQIAMLRRMRCDAVQGFGIARPLSLGAFYAFALARKPVPAVDPLSI